MIIRNYEAAVRANTNKAVFDLQTCLDRRDAPQLHGRTMQPLAALSHAGPHAESFFCFLPKKTFACSETGCNLGSSEINSLLALGSEQQQKVGT